MTKLRPINDYCSDCAVHGEPVLSDQEKAFRRGFHHGAYLASQAIHHGASESQITSWIRQIYQWRLQAQYWLRNTTVKARRPPPPPGQ